MTVSRKVRLTRHIGDLDENGHDIYASSVVSMVPYVIPVGETFEVPIYRQALFAVPIDIAGALVVNGILQGVD